MSTQQEKIDADKPQKQSVHWGAYFALIFAMVFFSGVMGGQQWLEQDWWEVFDFATLNGKFGLVAANFTSVDGVITVTKSTFKGLGGNGAMEGFLFAFGLVPTVMFALGMINVLEHYGALEAARKLLTPIIRPMIGIPGSTGLAIIGSLQSTDVGASLTRSLKNQEQLTENQTDIFAMFQFSAGAMLTNFFSSGAILFTLTDASGALSVPTTIGVCFCVMFVMKIVGANLMRLYLALTNLEHTSDAVK